MSFDKAFSATSSSQGEAVASVPSVQGAFQAGVFADGLVVILEAELSSTIAKFWAWALPGQIQPVICTAFGDFFFQPAGGGSIYFFETQRGRTEFVGPDLGSFFNDFLPADRIREHVLHEPLFRALKARLGSLAYGTCFIPEPWPLLGGSGNEDSFVVGRTDAYISLVSQTLKQLRDNTRSVQ
ncbi:MAG: T6SS immunity protein Tdi1 domain-containing protein [Gammaproteobacteria bacterium]